jgi:hypothetical protein
VALAIDTLNSDLVIANAGAAPLVADPINPAANSLILVIVSADDNVTPCTAAISDNQSHTYTRHVRSNTNGTTEVWSYYTTTALTGLVVTATFTNAWNSNNTGLLCVQVVTGATNAQPGTINSATTNTVSITPQATGSYIFGAYCSTDTSALATALDANTTIIQSVNGGAGGFALSAFRSSNTTASLSSTTYGTDSSRGATQDIVAVEILAGAVTTLFPAPFITA